MVTREPPWGKSCPLPRNTDHLVSADEADRDGPKPRGPDWAERNPEAAAHEAARHRARITRGVTSGGRRL